MFSLEREIEELRPSLGDARTGALLARERREVFSLHPELRVAAWAGAMLLASAAGLVLKNNLDRIGPVALSTLLGLAALACYAFAWRAAQPRDRATAQPISDYILLLGALLLSADVAFIETQFHLLEHHWPRHFLFLAIAHGVGAYVYRSRMLLSLSITALAAFMGIERSKLRFISDLTIPALLCSGLLIAWRQLHAVILSRADGEGPPAQFLRIFEHFAANLALGSGLFLLSKDETFFPGCMMTLAFAAIVTAWGFKHRVESFVLYAFVYAVIAADALVLRYIAASSFVVLVSVIAAIATLIVIHRRFHERRT